MKIFLSAERKIFITAKSSCLFTVALSLISIKALQREREAKKYTKVILERAIKVLE